MLFSRKNRTSKRTKQTTRQLQMERMEERRLMAADVTLDGSLLRIEGSEYSDKIFVENVGTSQLRASVLDLNGNVRAQQTVNRNSVSQLIVDGNSGNDEITNFTDKRMVARGGYGNDKITGGNNNDWLMGDSGNDEIYGRGGNDKIEGGWAHDKLYGDSGDDTIYGNHGDDFLYGGNGNDNLYGGDGYDRVYGEAGNDGLFGGDDFDRLYAGTGRDRILKDYRNYDSVYQTSSDDAFIYFKDGSNYDHQIGDSTATYSGGTWNDSSIEAVDVALERLHDLTGNTTLLKPTYNTNSMVFHRQGNWLSATGVDGNPTSDGVDVGGWNTRTGHIYLNNLGMSGDVLPVEQVVIHEIGHNWDWEVNPTIDKFYSESGWTQSPTTEVKSYNRRTGHWTRVVINNDTGGNPNDNWWHAPGATNFVSAYASESAYEDFAESFAAFAMGSDFVGYAADGSLTDGILAAPGKLLYMQDFIADLA